MRKLFLPLLGACSALVLATPASAVLVGASNIDIAGAPFTFAFGDGSFTFSYQPTEAFDVDPVVLTTTGTAVATAFGGFLGIPLVPSTFFTDANIEVGPDIFPGFAAFPNPTQVPFSIVDGDLGLRVSAGRDDYFGYARFGGSTIASIAFETTPNTPIVAGSFGAAAVPEPAAWTLTIAGLAATGAMLRRRRAMARPACG